MSSSAGPSRVSRPRRSSGATSNGSAASSTGTDDGARTGACAGIFVSGNCETMALYLGSERGELKGLTAASYLSSSRRTQGPITTVACCYAKRLPHRATDTSRGMGPRARGDDDCLYGSRHRVEAPGQNAFLCMQAVFGFVEHHRLRAVD